MKCIIDDEWEVIFKDSVDHIDLPELFLEFELCCFHNTIYGNTIKIWTTVRPRHMKCIIGGYEVKNSKSKLYIWCSYLLYL